MVRTITYQIAPEFEGATISYYLKQQGFTGKSNRELKNRDGAFSANGSVCDGSFRLTAGDLLQVSITEMERSEGILPENLPLAILYEDEDILVVDKPAGMAIHPSVNHREGTLANAVAGYYARQGIPYVFRCLNRLDKETSGVTVLAKHSISGSILSKQVKEGGFVKEYRAIVCGSLPAEGDICLPIGRKAGSIIERCIDMEHGREAVTHYRKISERGKYSFAAVKLDTGRTHQIRLHMKAIGHPLPGDYLYHPDFEDIKRQPLHCYRMELTHPITGERMAFVAELPEDMQRLL